MKQKNPTNPFDQYEDYCRGLLPECELPLKVAIAAGRKTHIRDCDDAPKKREGVHISSIDLFFILSGHTSEWIIVTILI